MKSILADGSWTRNARAQIERALETTWAARPPTEVVRAARYATLGGGHRWRSLMALAAGGIFRDDADSSVLPLAVALEMMHAASLVLDDLPSMDNAATRRGKACVHLVFPEWVVDMLPAFLVNSAYGCVVANPDAPAECRVRALHLLAEMGARLARGQERDLALARQRVTEPELLECYALKSGSLFAAALAGGALLCGAGDNDAKVLCTVGEKMGQAYQILDDLADGSEEDSEYKESGRFTAYVLLGPGEARARAKRLLEEVEAVLAGFGERAMRLRRVLSEIQGSEEG